MHFLGVVLVLDMPSVPIREDLTGELRLQCIEKPIISESKSRSRPV